MCAPLRLNMAYLSMWRQVAPLRRSRFSGRLCKALLCLYRSPNGAGPCLQAELLSERLHKLDKPPVLVFRWKAAESRSVLLDDESCEPLGFEFSRTELCFGQVF